jgi:hypothetical protein
MRRKVFEECYKKFLKGRIDDLETLIDDSDRKIQLIYNYLGVEEKEPCRELVPIKKSKK